MIAPPSTKINSLGKIYQEKFLYRRLVMIGIYVFSQNVLHSRSSLCGKYRNSLRISTRSIIQGRSIKTAHTSYDMLYNKQLRRSAHEHPTTQQILPEFLNFESPSQYRDALSVLQIALFVAHVSTCRSSCTADFMDVPYCHQIRPTYTACITTVQHRIQAQLKPSFQTMLYRLLYNISLALMVNDNLVSVVSFYSSSFFAIPRCYLEDQLIQHKTYMVTHSRTNSDTYRYSSKSSIKDNAIFNNENLPIQSRIQNKLNSDQLPVILQPTNIC